MAGLRSTTARGGELVYGTYGEAPSYDPLTTLAVPSHGAANLAIYDSLMRANQDGGIEPYLAESMETTDGGTRSHSARCYRHGGCFDIFVSINGIGG